MSDIDIVDDKEYTVYGWELRCSQEQYDALFEEVELLRKALEVLSHLYCEDISIGMKATGYKNGEYKVIDWAISQAKKELGE